MAELGEAVAQGGAPSPRRPHGRGNLGSALVVDTSLVLTPWACQDQHQLPRLLPSRKNQQAVATCTFSEEPAACKEAPGEKLNRGTEQAEKVPDLAAEVAEVGGGGRSHRPRRAVTRGLAAMVARAARWRFADYDVDFYMLQYP